jgi:hypothetical protein
MLFEASASKGRLCVRFRFRARDAGLVSGVAALGDVRRLGRLGGITVAYYLCATGLAVAIH